MAAAVPFIVMAVSTVMQINAQKEQQRASQRIADRKAAELETRAKSAVAVGQRKMLEERRRKDLVASRAVALAAASGGSVSDPTVVDILADIEGEGTYRESVALYNGEEEARQLREDAAAVREGAEAEQRAGGYQQLAILTRGASSMYSMYGGGGYSGYG